MNGQISTFTDSCTICDRTTNLGTHRLCVLSSVFGPGGTNTVCAVSNTGNQWRMRLFDGADSGNSQGCSATCFD